PSVRAQASAVDQVHEHPEPGRSCLPVVEGRVDAAQQPPGTVRLPQQPQVRLGPDADVRLAARAPAPALLPAGRGPAHRVAGRGGALNAQASEKESTWKPVATHCSSTRLSTT